MSKYRAVPYEVEAVQFLPPFREVAPDWLLAAYKRGDVAVTLGPKGKYVTVYRDGDMTRGYVGDWICIDQRGEVSVIGRAVFEERFRAA